MTFNERDVLGLLGTYCQFLVTFWTKMPAIHLADQIYICFWLPYSFAENAILHECVITKGNSILTIFSDNNGYSETMPSQNLGSG